MSEEKLNEIKTLLEDIKGIMFLTNQEEIQSAIRKLLKTGSVEETVYKLCDGENTTTDIMVSIQKDQKYTNAVLSNLRQKGLIRTVEKDSKKVHEQRF